jgi:hypothetical protein
MSSGDGAVAHRRSRLTAVLWAAAERPRQLSACFERPRQLSACFEPFAEVEPPHNSGKEGPARLGQGSGRRTTQMFSTLTCLLATQLLRPGSDEIVGNGRSLMRIGSRERERGATLGGDGGIWTNGAGQGPDWCEARETRD